MSLNFYQELFRKERRDILYTFNDIYRTTEEKEEALKDMENSDIEFLIYCSDTLYLKFFYSKFLKK